MKKSMIVLILFLFGGLSCYENPEVNHSNGQIFSENETMQQSGPDILLEIEREIFLDKPLKFKWLIRNPGPRKLFVYSSLLESPGSALIVVNSKKKLIDIQFTDTQPSGIIPYDFPETRTIVLDRDENYSGDYSSKELLRNRLLLSNDGQIGQESLTRGEWKIRILVAYGENDKGLRTKDDQNDEHPINQVVRWQKLAYSPYIPVNIR